MIKWIIKTFGLKGSWKWAKRQMKKGCVVKSKSWSGALLFKIDDSENQLLLRSFSRTLENAEWETSNFHFSNEEFTDYEVVGLVLEHPDQARHHQECGTEYRGCSPKCQHYAEELDFRKRIEEFNSDIGITIPDISKGLID